MENKEEKKYFHDEAVREEAFELQRLGFAVPVISKKINVPISTIYSWFKGEKPIISLTERIRAFQEVVESVDEKIQNLHKQDDSLELMIHRNRDLALSSDTDLRESIKSTNVSVTFLSIAFITFIILYVMGWI